MSSIMVYCRFCAEEKHSDDVINFLTETEQRTEVIEKLSLFSNNFIDFDNKTLPEYICETCFKSLVFSYQFFVNVKASQETLQNIFSKSTLTEKVELDDKNDDCDYDTHFEEAPPPSWSSYPWRCSHCDLTTDSLTNLRAHTKVHHNMCYGYSCVDCDEKVDELEEFVDHVVGHREELRAYCEHCNSQSTDPSHRDSHYSEHCCTLCGERFPEETALLHHLKQYATRETGLLAFDVSIYESYETTQVLSWTDYPCICKFCKIRVFSKDFLISHCMSAHDVCFGMQCMDCDDTTDTFSEFIQHVYTHRPELKSYCPYCDANIEEDHTHIDTHTDSTHQCGVCGEIFAHKRKLRRHELGVNSTLVPPKKKRKRQLTEEDLTCKTCGAILKTEFSLKAHETLHRTREKHYTCDRCGLAYYTKGSLDVHTKTHHSDKTQDTTETCKICKKTFVNLSRLRKHVRTHNLDRPFQCDYCKKNFSSKERLRSHISLHNDVLRFHCNFCSKKFRHRSILKVHENQHTGLRPYSCDFCDMVFANWSNCNKHMKRKHDKTLAKSVMTPQGKILLNPKTGKPYKLEINNVVKEWSEKILSGKRKNNKYRGEFKLH